MTLAQLTKVEMNDILSKAKGMSTSQVCACASVCMRTLACVFCAACFGCLLRFALPHSSLAHALYLARPGLPFPCCCPTSPWPLPAPSSPTTHALPGNQLRSEINKLEGATAQTTSLASAARTQSLGGIVRGGQLTEVSVRVCIRVGMRLLACASRSDTHGACVHACEILLCSSCRGLQSHVRSARDAAGQCM